MPLKYRLTCPICGLPQSRIVFFRAITPRKPDLRTACRGCGTALRTGWIWMLVTQLAFAIPACVVYIRLAPSTRNPTEELALLLASFGVAIGLYALAFPYFTRYSRAHPAGRCRRCGYELRDIASECCPECGAAREFTSAKP